MTQPAQTQAVQLLAAYQAAGVALRANVVQMLLNLWRNLGSWRNTDIDRFVTQAVQIVQAGQQHTASLTVAQLTRAAQLAGHALPPTVPIGLAVGARNVDPAIEYERPFHDVWRALGDGADLTDAVTEGGRHLENLAATDLQLAKTATAHHVLSGAAHVTGYRRVLEGPRSCGLCIVASTQRYHRGELMPIHPGCDCSVEPIFGTDDPGRVIDEQSLVDAHAAIADRFGADSTAARTIRGAYNDRGGQVLYRDVLITHQHGEIGPVLAVRGQTFTGPADLVTSSSRQGN